LAKAFIFIILRLMEDLNRDLLGVSVNSVGLAQLKRLVRGARWTLILGILLNFAYLLNSALRTLEFGNLERLRGNLPYYLVLKLHVWYVIVLAALSIFQLYLFWAFSKRSTAACEAADSDRFNESLNLLNRFNRLAQLTILISAAFMVIELWSTFSFLSRISHFPN
jgi:hypothetical protein